ncbi:uncharacterized protein BDZ99DRAFT_523573 [Mytilinidion resinicola]|uniref:PhoD-like phosphatase domain-containing protein n=1 Tax=Mytilinidion resinicola TaxID=574789 RepID=A0A6A6YEN2_9PEZI|nr:uncharacterized protein BDZ99DRAFT_523573 [Mytilinidion resinicola]KAF2807028.1 hypothetical protein BDZ99DRAFT_523573 [Mytilinidion resinicola]
MSERMTTGSYAPRQGLPPSGALPDNYPQKRSSYRRPPEPAQPVNPNSESPVIPGYTPSNTTRQYSGTQPTNGVSRASSHRRRDSQHYAPPPSANSVPLPTAPDVPRAPPSSYKDPYGTTNPSRSQGTSRSYSTRSRGPPQPMAQAPVTRDVSRDLPTIQIPSSRPLDSRATAASPTSPVSPTAGAVSRRESAARRGSVPDRSPLQVLERKIDDISKEEKRARIQEIELAAQERVEAERAARRALTAANAQKRTVSGGSGPTGGSVPTRTVSNRRHVSMPSKVARQLGEEEGELVDLTPPWDPTQPPPPNTQQPRIPQTGDRGYQTPVASSGSQRRNVPTSYFDGQHGPASAKGKEPVGVSRGASFRDRSGPPTQSTDVAGQESYRRDRNSMIEGGAAATGLGLYGMNEAQGQRRSSGAPVSRHDSKRLVDKELPPAPKEAASSRDSRGILAAQRQMEQERMEQAQKSQHSGGLRVPDPVPAKAVKNVQVGPTYEIPPQTAAGQVARDRVGFGTANPDDVAAKNLASHQHSHTSLPNPFHRHHDPERRYQAPKVLDEWKMGKPAILLAPDLDLEAPEIASNAANKAWWEQNQSQRRRASSSYKDANNDGSYEESTGQTSFNPPLYLKCGPLLRYSGMRKDMARDIWRGSVMIVTTDEYSSYQTPPTLRLFKQPMDLLPPPPVELDTTSGQQLDPEYVDPLAGQVKVSRSGKTLFVKPVDMLREEADLSRVEDDTGLFEEKRTSPYGNDSGGAQSKSKRLKKRDGERVGKVKEIPGIRLHAERGVTFWRFNLEVELSAYQTRVAYRINQGPAIGFWVPARGETMNMMFHSCNGFSLSVQSNEFCGPDPMWRDVLNNHQTRPFHVMIGGGDQIYNDAAMRDTKLFREWTESKHAVHKHNAEFSTEMQNEMEDFYLSRYSMWFSQGLFGMANSQIPMVNIWDDHDIIDGFGSYPHHFMSTPVFTGVGAVAFKYYMLFQHQSVVDETEKTEPSWLLGSSPGPYINELSRSLFMFLGRKVAFLGLDCRTERQRDEIVSEKTYDLVFDRLDREIIKGETKHLIVLLGVPIAYPRLNFLEMVLTSRLMDPVKAMGRMGMLGGFVNKFDGGVEILDDLDDHWTAKHHKEERNWFIEELQHLAAEKSVRITILGGDVHLGAVGQFYSNKKLGIPKDRDHRYMPNIVSSAIVNTPPPDMMADVLNKRNKIHHLNAETDEDMIPMFSHDVDGKPRNNKHLLPRRNWCSLREYHPGTTPPTSRSPSPSAARNGPTLMRTLSDSRPGKLVRRLSRSGTGPPPAYFNNPSYATAEETGGRRRNSFSRFMSRGHSADAIPQQPPGSSQSKRNSISGDPRNSLSGNPRNSVSFSQNSISADPSNPPRPNPFHRRPTLIGRKSATAPMVDLHGGLDIVLNVEVSQKDPAGITTPYRLLIPALDYEEPSAEQPAGVPGRRKSTIGTVFGSVRGRFAGRKKRTVGDDGYSQSGIDTEDNMTEDEEGYAVPPRSSGAGAVPAQNKGKMPMSGDAQGANVTALPQQPAQPIMTLGGGGHRRISYSQPDSPPTRAVQPARVPPPPRPQQQQQQQQQQPKPQVRTMGGILGSERDDRFERDAHVLTHTPSTRADGGAGAGAGYAGRQAYNGAGRYDDDDDYTDGTVTPPPKKRASWKIWK